jgi:hypothetical protein
MTVLVLERLDTAIARARNPVDTACLRAERACLLARRGNLAMARKAIDEIQQRFAWRPHAAISAWVSLAQGMMDHYSHLGPSAHDKVRRAYALSGATDLKRLHVLSAAWLSQMDFVHRDMLQMVSHVVEALAHAAPDHHAARSRASLVVASAYHHAGEAERAKPWYAKARIHAVADGDEATLSASMHNQAGMGAMQLRLDEVSGEVDRAQVRRVLMAAESAGHFDAGVGIGVGALSSLVPMLRAPVLVVDGQYELALSLYRRHIDAAMRDGLARMQACFLADMAWCRLHLEQQSLALLDAAAAQESLSQPCDVDDRAIALARLAMVHRRLGNEAHAVTLHERALRDLATHRSEQARVAALLDDGLATLKA